MSLRIFRSVRRLRRLLRFGGQLESGNVPSPTELLFLGRMVGGSALSRIFLPLLIISGIADIVKMLVVDKPWESPDDKRRQVLKDMYGETEGEARWQKEFQEREIQIDLSGESA